ncbi:MAG: hypothetical protein E6Q92_11875 [Burkholderiaceae bacterium]|nr:MAG: hypothetical protein E6Q92_11875 [Burkholderiaceae bacterium]
MKSSSRSTWSQVLSKTCAPLLAIGVALLAGCGGSGSVKDPFRPARLMVVGDEASYIGANDAGLTGAQYSVNRYKTDATTGKPTLPLTIDCLSYGNWAIRLAADINSVVATSTDELTNSPRFNFAQCNPNNKSTAATFMMAAKSQTVDSAIAAIDAHVASKGVQAGDLFAVYVGNNDIWAQYALFAGNADAVKSGAKAAATKLAKRINQLTDQGAKVLIVALPDLGYSPYARAEALRDPSMDRAALISDMVTEFNRTLKTTLIDDGRRIGLVSFDSQLSSQLLAFRSGLGTSMGLTNIHLAACTTASSLNCDVNTIVGDPSTWLWADGKQLGQPAQAMLASMASSRLFYANGF